MTLSVEEPNSRDGIGKAPVLPRLLYSDESADLLEWGRVLLSRWKIIMLSTLAPAVVIFVVANFALTPKWGAVATLRPLNKQSQMLHMMGFMGGDLLGAMGSSMGAMLGVPRENEEAQEYMTTMQSYDFTLKLIADHRLEPYLEGKPGWFSWLIPAAQPDPRARKWDFFKTMTGRFYCEFDTDTGNLELRFVDENKSMAMKVLGWYVDGLREMLRTEEIRDSHSALAALREQATTTPDVFLQSQLFQLGAVQIMNVKMAEAQSDFAFKELQSPIVPNRPYSPRPVLDAAVSAVAGMLASLLWILVAVTARRHRVLVVGTENGVAEAGESFVERAPSAANSDE